MKILCVLLAAFAYIYPVYAQSCTAIFDCKKIQAAHSNKYIRCDAFLFNQLTTHFGIRDTVRYQVDNGFPSYFYKDEEIKDWKYDRALSGKKFMVKRATRYFLASIPAQKGESAVYEAICDERTNRLMFKTYREKDGQRFGKCEVKNRDGKIRILGTYDLKDTLYTIRTKSFNPETYEEEIREENHNKISVRSGTWTYFDDDGQLIRQENYDTHDVLDHHPGNHDALCHLFDFPNVQERNPYTGRRIPTMFRIFNYIATMLHNDDRIAYDVRHDGTIYYCNGKIDRNLYSEGLRHYAESFENIWDDGTLKLTYSSNELGAWKPKDEPYRCRYKAIIPRTDASQEVHVFDGTKLKRYYQTKGHRNDLYEEWTCNGKLLTRGRYMQIDTFYRDTVIVFDSKTYEERVTITESTVASKKCGEWTYFDADGILRKEEHYRKCQ